uniref:Putative 16 kDa thioredoxion n=1 Tax=Ixodes ricinus TaxID=34613 RepID=A0A0K8RA69_IXORI
MELFKGKTLVKKDGSEVPAEQVLSGKKVVGLYFSAHWCPPCRMFTPILAEAYEEAQEGDEPFEIVFVSSDRAASEMLSYMKESHGNWCGLKHGDPLVQELKQKFGISGIPTLIVVNESGKVITSDGRSDISSEGPRAFAKWLSAA